MNSSDIIAWPRPFVRCTFIGIGALCLQTLALAVEAKPEKPAGSGSPSTIPSAPGVSSRVLVYSRVLGSTFADRSTTTQVKTTTHIDVEYLYTAVWTVQPNNHLRGVETFKVGSKPVENIDITYPGNFGGFVYETPSGGGISLTKSERRYIHLVADSEVTVNYDAYGTATGTSVTATFNLRDEDSSETDPQGTPGTTANWDLVTETNLDGAEAQQRIAGWPGTFTRIGGVGDLGGVSFPQGFAGLQSQEYSSSVDNTTGTISATQLLQDWDIQNPFPSDASSVADTDPATAFFQTPSATTKSLQKMQYRIALTSSSPAVINWVEVFTPKNPAAGGITVFKSWTPANGETESSLYTIDPQGLDAADGDATQRQPGQDGKWEITQPKPIEFQARSGQVNEGFDPPLDEPSDLKTTPIWHTSVGKAAPHNTNEILKLVFASAEMAAEYELFIPEASEPYVEVTPKVFTVAQTDLIITGKNGGDPRFPADILIKKKSDGSVYGKLIVDVMPWREVNVKVYKLQPDSILERGRIVAVLPSVESIQNELNARFRQACISFNLSPTITSVFHDYDVDLDGNLQASKLSKAANGVYTPSRQEVDSIIGIASQFTGQLNIVFVKLLADTFEDKTKLPPDDINTVTNNSLGITFTGENPIKRVGFIAADFPAFQQASQESADGAVDTIQRVAAHETGHTLDLSTRTLIRSRLSEMIGLPREKHDGGAVPSGTLALMRPGPSGAPGKWMRFEDWRQANDIAGELTP